MRQLGFLLLVILVKSCMAQNRCGKKTKPACKKEGGICQLKTDLCDGEILTGKKYCKNFKKCQCCLPEILPSDCSVGTLLPCEALNGTCISHDAVCDTCEVINKAFCKPGTCKCCFTVCDPTVCNPSQCETEDGVVGKCSRYPIKNFVIAGQQQCAYGCDCWIPECTSIGDRCVGNGSFCIGPDKSCHDDFIESYDCYKPNIVNGSWSQQHCKCCKPLPTGCDPKINWCDDKHDYCIENRSEGCHKGYGIVHNACFKTPLRHPHYNSNPKRSQSLNISFPCLDCDCCKSLACRSIGENCTGKGDFCIDPAVNESCPAGYRGSIECQKPVIENNFMISYKNCLCCKPKPTDCGPECYSPNTTTCVCMPYGQPCPEGHCHYEHGHCPHNGCVCCKDLSHTECKPTSEAECSVPDDYCVLKNSGNCRKGFVKVLNACYESCITHHTCIFCDCCKSLGCIPSGDRCSGRRDFCIDYEKNCPFFYKASFDCHKVTASGKWSPCKCCKPLFSECVEKKFWEKQTVITGRIDG